jgi:hypothetical protein
MVILRTRGAPDSLRRIRLSDGHELPIPTEQHDQILAAGFDWLYQASARPLIFYGDWKSLQVAEGGKAWIYEGEAFPFDVAVEAAGQLRVILAHGVRAADNGWELIERRVATQSDITDLSELENGVRLRRDRANQDLRAGEQRFLAPMEWATAWGDDDEYLAWYETKTVFASVRYRAYRDSPQLGLPILIGQADRWAELTDLKSVDPRTSWLGAQLRGDHLLVFDGEGSQARLFNATDGSVIWRAPPNSRCLFWEG